MSYIKKVSWRLNSYGIWVNVAGVVIIDFSVEQPRFFLNCLILKTKARRYFENQLPSDVSYPIILGSFVTVLWEIRTSQKLSFYHIYLFLPNFCIHFSSPKILYVPFCGISFCKTKLHSPSEIHFPLYWSVYLAVCMRLQSQYAIFLASSSRKESKMKIHISMNGPVSTR